MQCLPGLVDTGAQEARIKFSQRPQFDILSDDEEHAQRQSTHRGGGVERLGDRHEADAGGIEGRDDPDGVHPALIGVE